MMTTVLAPRALITLRDAICNSSWSLLLVGEEEAEEEEYEEMEEEDEEGDGVVGVAATLHGIQSAKTRNNLQ